jgi:CheY-like chemotaxis protein
MTRRLTVLAVDDDPDTLDTLTQVLSLGGHEPAVAADGPSAVRAAAEVQPDVVLLDIRLPGMDGYEVGRAIKRSRPRKPPLVVSLSASAADPARAGEAGIDLHLTKPLQPAALLGLLGRFGRVLETGEEVQDGPLTVHRPGRI